MRMVSLLCMDLIVVINIFSLVVEVSPDLITWMVVSQGAFIAAVIIRAIIRIRRSIATIIFTIITFFIVTPLLEVGLDRMATWWVVHSTVSHWLLQRVCVRIVLVLGVLLVKWLSVIFGVVVVSVLSSVREWICDIDSGSCRFTHNKIAVMTLLYIMNRPLIWMFNWLATAKS